MQFPPLTEIRLLRKKLGLTQQQLAKAAGLSQSLIAKTESGKLEPAYSKAVALFDALEEYGKQTELKASQLMNKKIVSVTPNTPLREAVHKFRQHDISQMPVFEKNHLAGVVSENDALAAIVEGKHATTVRDVMEEAPPIISPQTPIKTISSLLRHCPLAVVAENGRPTGVITRADLLEPLYEK